jgi:hypothetical protein
VHESYLFEEGNEENLAAPTRTQIHAEWLLMLLSSVNKDSKARILLLLWHAWFLRNDVTHGKGLATVKGSTEFLLSYASTLHISSGERGMEPSDKGKEVVCEGGAAMSQSDGEHDGQEPQC